MTEQEIAIKDESSTDDWLMGCTMCDEGLCTFIDDLIVQKKVKQSKAIKIATELANEKIGVEFFSIGAIKQKYYRGKGVVDPPKKKKEVQIKPKAIKETPENKEPLTETPEPVTATTSDQLARDLATSLQSVVTGLKAFNELEELTQDESLRQELAYSLVDFIPEAKMALNRINKGE